MAHDHAVEPAHSPRTSCRCAVLTADFTYMVSTVIEQFSREWPVSDPRSVGFAYTDDIFDGRCTDTASYSHVAGNRVTGCNERIRAVVDVEHDTLCTFKQYFAVILERIIQDFCRVCNVRCQALSRFFIWFVYFIKCESVAAIQCFESVILYPEVLLKPPSECLIVDEVRHADADALYFVHIARTDAALSRADLIFSARFLFQLILKQVIGQDNLCTV